MRKNSVRNGITFGMAAMMAAIFMAGCGSTKETAETPATSVATEATVQSETNEDMQTASTDFSKGVYVNYAKEAENPPKTYFYVFNTDTSGFTADGEHDDTGLPFDTVQEDGKVKFTFGGADESEDVLIITGKENGMIYGYFEDSPERELVFEPVSGVDPEGFSAVSYLNAAKGEELVYKDANGWSVKYDPSCISVNGGGPVTGFVYTGDCAGTCMITATYDVDMDAKAKAEDLAKSYGDSATVRETIFPGTEDVKGFYVDAVPGQTGPGLYESAFVRDYMDGYLVFDITTHVSGDDAIDIPISDKFSAIIDTISFE